MQAVCAGRWPKMKQILQRAFAVIPVGTLCYGNLDRLRQREIKDVREAGLALAREGAGGWSLQMPAGPLGSLGGID